MVLDEIINANSLDLAAAAVAAAAAATVFGVTPLLAGNYHFREEAFEVTVGCTPVSYTHLDVYKRQHHNQIICLIHPTQLSLNHQTSNIHLRPLVRCHQPSFLT